MENIRHERPSPAAAPGAQPPPRPTGSAPRRFTRTGRAGRMVTGHVYRVDTRSEPARQLVERCIGGPPNICAQKNPAGQKVCRTIPSQSVSRSSSNIVPVLHSLRCACLAVIRAEATALGLGPRQILAGFCLPIPMVARAVIDLRTLCSPTLALRRAPHEPSARWNCYASLPNGGSTMLMQHSLTMRATRSESCVLATGRPEIFHRSRSVC